MVQPSSELDDPCLLSLPGESQPKVANPQVAGSNPAGRTAVLFYQRAPEKKELDGK